MDLNVLIFIIIVVAAGLLAFAVTMYIVALFRQNCLLYTSRCV